MKRILVLAGFLGVCTVATAAEQPSFTDVQGRTSVAEGRMPGATDYPDLPSLAVVTEVMENSPQVKAAAAGIELEQANERGLNAGPYEFNVTLGAKQRNTDSEGNFNEWEAGLERGLRLPGKARIDQQLGIQGVRQARLALGDALHESGRTLLRSWFSWRQEHAQVKQWQAQVEVLQQQLGIVNKRIEAGDAPVLERSLSEAALAQATYALKQAELRAQMAATDIQQRYVGLTLPADPAFMAPEPLRENLDYWRTRILEHNHELALIRGEVERAQLHINRASADRTPDPTVGLNTSSERNGAEQVTGLFLSIPLSGSARAATQSAALAQASISAQNEADTLRRLNAEIINTYASASSAYESWQSAQTAADAMQHNAGLMTRAYSLGEASLSETLNARRQALETGLAAALAQLNARETRYRLMLDAHLLWPLDKDEDAADAEHVHY
ncbi:MAG: TolC family protein [Gammaproteobacteria bacterium]|nr:TolC family protein [Gammaproteobacteria bacterium]